MPNYAKALDKANKARSKAASEGPVRLIVAGAEYSLVFNTAPDRMAYDVVLNGEVQVRLTAFTKAKAKADATHWLLN